ncbi:MAG TPA: hypothetical protein VNB06_08695 [Thermoanaerobaculia bacterium]|nr:hypothetical protein [Thermoanaerobaculia bacterium]
MHPSELRFGSLLVYTKRGASEVSRRAQVFVTRRLKANAVVVVDRGEPVTATTYLARRYCELVPGTALDGWIDGETLLVPVPGSGLTVPHALWVPRNLASALLASGVGAAVAPLLRRERRVAKSAFADPGYRPKPREHYESMSLEATLVGSVPPKLCLIDDVVAKGSTLLGAAWRLAEACPDVEIRAFAAVRHVGYREEIETMIEPVLGSIRLDADEDATREP